MDQIGHGLIGVEYRPIPGGHGDGVRQVVEDVPVSTLLIDTLVPRCEQPRINGSKLLHREAELGDGLLNDGLVGPGSLPGLLRELVDLLLERTSVRPRRLRLGSLLGGRFAPPPLWSFRPRYRNWSQNLTFE